MAVDDAATTAEDTAVSVAVLPNDTDLDGDTLTVTRRQRAGARHARRSTPDGTITYTPAANYHGADSFSYTVGDGNGGTRDGDGQRDGDARRTTARWRSTTRRRRRRTRRSAIAVLANDTDLDGDTLTVTRGQRAGARHGRGQRRRDDHLHAGGELQRRGQLQLHDRRRQRRHARRRRSA